MCLSQDTSECSAGHFSMLWNRRCYQTARNGLCELNMAADLPGLIETRFQSLRLSSRYCIGFTQRSLVQNSEQSAA